MKRLVKTLSLAIVVLLISAAASAQSVEDLTLTVSSDGVTKDEAVKNALRSAIEQVFGTFVSANTTILNDELVKDEVVTLSNGNIKNYNELSAVQLPNGNTFVTLSATVSLSKLTSYAKSKGSTCEFAGATFGANMKLMELNIENTKKVLDNLIIQLQELAPYMYDYELKLDEPTAKGDIGVTIYCKSNSTTKIVYYLIMNTFEAINNSHKKFDYRALRIYNIYSSRFVGEKNLTVTIGGVDMTPYFKKIEQILAKALNNFKLTSNNGAIKYYKKTSDFYEYLRGSLSLDKIVEKVGEKSFYVTNKGIAKNYRVFSSSNIIPEFNTGKCKLKLLNNRKRIDNGKFVGDAFEGFTNQHYNISEIPFYLEGVLFVKYGCIHIPLDEISKVTNISIENKSMSK